MALTLQTARHLIDTSEARARELNITITTVVVDSGGFPLALSRMDGAGPMTASIATSKAYTAAVMRRASGDLMPMAEQRPQFFAAVSRMGLVPLVPGLGGVTVRESSEIVGGIGVSGGTAEQDLDCAQAALKAVGAV
jgi:uncharacterized protein GlcG (DUF336 family)